MPGPAFKSGWLSGAPQPPSDRQAVLAQTVADDKALAGVRAQYANCRWDNLAAFKFQFAPEDITTVDYFHPSVTGQSHIAALTWAASYWPGL